MTAIEPKPISNFYVSKIGKNIDPKDFQPITAEKRLLSTTEFDAAKSFIDTMKDVAERKTPGITAVV